MTYHANELRFYTTILSLTGSLGRPPTMTELSAECRCSRGVTHKWVQRLRDRGVLRDDKLIALSPRSMRIVGQAVTYGYTESGAMDIDIKRVLTSSETIQDHRPA
jgi:hypothetical protein